MLVREEDIYQITESVWNSMLGLEMWRRKEALPEPPHVRFLTGSVQISGAWHGVFRLDCSVALARRIAAIMFGFETSETTIDDVRDALGELTNITGGNVKGFLPTPCHMALPVVVDGTSYVIHLPRGRIMAQMDLECEREPFRVTLLSLPRGSMSDESPREGQER